MNTFFLVLEMFGFAFAAYLFFKKKELGIVYLPVLFFADTVITTHIIPSVFFYAIVFILLLRSVVANPAFTRYNVFAVLLFVYFLILTTRSENLAVFKEHLFNVLFFFISLPLIHAIYKKYSREVIFKELSQSAFVILLIFIANVVLSTIFSYNVHFMYGITSGILYGNLFATDFNILSIALFLVLVRSLQTKNFIYLVAILISLWFIGVSLRRTVMFVSLLAIVFSIMVVIGENAKKVLIFGSIAIVLGGFLIVEGDIQKEFIERYELRNLENRDLSEEKRYFEYDLVYNDMFKYNRYSPWYGYELLNSPKNYGGGIFFDRSLHSDLPSIAHSSGLIGVALYLLMIFTAFYQSFKKANTKGDKWILLFCAIAFITFTASGRFTEFGSMLLLFLTVLLPITKHEAAMALKLAH